MKTARMLSAIVLLTASGTAVADSSSACGDRLTFRWTSGNPIRTDVEHPDDASLKNEPFLRDPEIVSVTTAPDRIGSKVTMKFGAASAAVLAAQSSTHVGQQMLIMSGDSVIAAAIVRDPLHDVAVLSVPYDGERLAQLQDALRSASCSTR